MLVRPAIPADAPAIAQIHVETWRAAYRGQVPDAVLDRLDVERRTAFWRERLGATRGRVFVAENEGGLAGFCDLIPSRDKDADSRAVAEIAAIYVLPQHWRKGAGRALCDRALAEAREWGCQLVTLWVLASNESARNFYEALGFGHDGTTKTEATADGHELHEVRLRMVL